MNMSDWISLGSSIGALGAALIALFTLKELSQQRKSVYKPDLCILNKIFDINNKGMIGQLSDLPLAVDWISHDQKQPSITDRPGIDIVNIGFGAAKNIKATWKFDLDSLIEEVNQIAQKTFQSFYLVSVNDFLSINVKNDKHLYQTNNKITTIEVEYLLPVTTQSSGHVIMFPPSYTLIVSVYLFLCLKDKRSLGDIVVPGIQLELTYEDIGKERHKSLHNLKGILSYMTAPSEIDKTTIPVFNIEYTEGQ